jgi:hypothetical protein
VVESKVEFMARAFGEVESFPDFHFQITVIHGKSDFERFDLGDLFGGMFWCVRLRFSVHSELLLRIQRPG